MSAGPDHGHPLRAAPEPIFNVPPVVTATLAVLGAIHAVRELLFSPKVDVEFLLLFAFIPARYDATALAQGAIPGGVAADVWSFVTYAGLHGDFVHFGF